MLKEGNSGYNRVRDRGHLLGDSYKIQERNAGHPNTGHDREGKRSWKRESEEADVWVWRQRKKEELR